MFNLTLPGIIALITKYGYAVIFPVAVVEGPIIAILSGFLASLGLFNVYIIFVILVFGDLTGDALYYCVGRFGAGPFMRRWGHMLGVSESKLLTFESYFNKHQVKALLLGKTQPTGSLVLATAGFAKMKFDRFLLVSLFGTIIKTGLLVIVGYYFGKSYNAIDSYLTKGGIILLVLTFILGIIYFEHMRRKKI